nr:MAG TPA: hypothetical protein [Caudoviricetes sp.]
MLTFVVSLVRAHVFEGVNLVQSCNLNLLFNQFKDLQK